MKKIILLLLIGIAVVLLWKTFSQEEDLGSSFTAVVIEINGNTLLVEPSIATEERRSADRIFLNLDNVVLKNKELAEITIQNIAVGDKVEISYDGPILEIYPAEIRGINRVVLLEE